MRAFNSNREAEELARAFMEQGIAIVAFNGVNVGGDCVSITCCRKAPDTSELRPY